MAPRRSKAVTPSESPATSKRRRKNSSDGDDEDFVPQQPEITESVVSDEENNGMLFVKTEDAGLRLEATQNNDDPSATPLVTPVNARHELRGLLDEENSAAREGMFNPKSYFFGWTDKWTPEWMYRLPGDVALRTIRESGTEGVGRIEVGQRLGMDTATKSGNRRVSNQIVTCTKEHPDHIGQFQKMEGKIRCIKYFWKDQSQPGKFQKLFEDFHKLTGRECPFKMGDIIKFPNSGLSTLRISDVSLRRLNDILEELSNEPVIVTIHRILKIIHSKELAQGYQFMIDKKSLMKCLKALEKERLLNVFDTTVESDNVFNKIQIVCRPEIISVDSPEVSDAIQRAIDSYHREGRVFPHGQLRFSIKKKAELAKAEESRKEDIALSGIDESNLSDIPVTLRYDLFRLQCSRATNVVWMSKHKNKTPHNAGTPENEKDDVNETINSQLDETMDANETLNNDVIVTPHPAAPMQQVMSNSLLSNGLDDPLSTGITPLPQEFSHMVRKKDLYDPHAEYGYQSKMVRAFVFHEAVFQFTRGHPDGTTPTVFDRFPPGQDPLSLPEKPIEDLPVFVDDESSLRFIPPCSSFTGQNKGWFMLQDFFNALPVSIYVMIAQVHKSVPRDLLTELLKDPIRRHTLMADLPTELRKPFYRDKKAIKQVEHNMLILCALGLGAIAPNPDAKRYATAHTSVFYVAKRARLYDTSSSDRGYAKVTLPLERYKDYIYDFKSLSDVGEYWHHFRAISQSTSLAFRIDQNSANEQREIITNRHKRYGLGMFEKSTVMRSMDEDLDILTPTPPQDGCAGVDSAMYVHLKRHWDLNPRPSALVAWFITRFRRQSDVHRPVVETRVECLQKDWNSYVRSLMPSDMEMTRKKKVKATQDDGLFPSRALLTLTMEPKTRIPSAPKGTRHKKRPLDSVDLISQASRLHVRSRFNSRERDMLILIRAVGFFLNPVYRFWLNPSVVRDIMHEYVPESRTKTVQSLMAAGVREMVRPNRLSYLQRIVRNLSTFQEMRALRFELASQPIANTEDKIAYFKNAFNTANRLLFMESQVMPSTSSSEATFETFLSNGQVVVSAEQNRGTAPLPLRSQKPTSLHHIHHCIATNVLMAVLIHSSSNDGEFSEEILEQLSASVIHNTLQVLRSDGLVSRARSNDPILNLTMKSHAILSYYFRHFFGHRFHPELIESIMLVNKMLDDGDGCAMALGEKLEDNPGSVFLAALTFYNRAELIMNLDETMIDKFAEVEQNSTKQIRQLENANLRLEKVEVLLGPSSLSQNDAESDEVLPTVEILIKLLDHSIPDDAFPPKPIEDWLLDVDSVTERADLRKVAMAIEAAEAFGATLAEIMAITHFNETEVKNLVKTLAEAYQVIEAGVDTRRVIWHAYADAWVVKAGKRMMVPRPWIKPTGGVCTSTIRWMCEAVLLAVVNKPGATIRDLRFRYEFALQPSSLELLIDILVFAECIVRKDEMLPNMTLSGPFEESPADVCVSYLLPSVDGIDRFARIFKDVPVIALVTSGPNGNMPSFATKDDSAPLQHTSPVKKDVILMEADRDQTPMENMTMD